MMPLHFFHVEKRVFSSCLPFKTHHSSLLIRTYVIQTFLINLKKKKRLINLASVPCVNTHTVSRSVGDHLCTGAPSEDFDIKLMYI